MKSRKLVILASASLAAMALTACGQKNPGTGEVAKFDASTYAGYQVDLNGDGTISDDEKGLTWAQSYDAIINKIKATSDNTMRYKLMHAAEDELMSTGAVTPLYYYTDIFLKKTDLTGFYASPLGMKFFEESKWGDSTEIVACIASATDTIDPALNSTVDGGTYDSMLFQGLMRWTHTGDYGKDGYAVHVTEGDAKSYTKTENADGTITYVFTLKDNLKWSDGTAYDANDYVRSWRRAVNKNTAADYAYLYEVIKGGAEAELTDKGEELAVSASEDGKQLSVTLVSDVPYFLELTAFPAFYPVPATADAKGEWCAQKTTPVSNGAMKVSVYDSTKIEMVKNDNFVDAIRVTATKITFPFSDDASAMLTAYQKGDYALIDDAPTSQLKTLQETIPDEYFNPGQLGTYYISFNIRSDFANAALPTEEQRSTYRRALGLMIDRNYIVDSVAQNGADPADGFVSKGLTEADGATDWTKARQPYYSVNSADQASNEAKAVEMMKDIGLNYDESTHQFTDAPGFTYLYNNGAGHKAIAEYLQQAWAKYGIKVTLESQEWATFISTRKAGDCDVARGGWLCDYNDPISMLDMFVSNSGNNDPGFGKAPL
ncbi:MAG: ABC transporter substrate-binding protein [Erysipelotrichaceae bacterium]|nr:ABC transporter substrate-binding protein [Erysipelotrichaceae bacterium]